VKTSSGASDRFLDGLVDGELVRSGVNGEFQGLGEAIGLDRVSKDSEVIIELLLELRDVAHVVDAFVEAPGELGSSTSSWEISRGASMPSILMEPMSSG